MAAGTGLDASDVFVELSYYDEVHKTHTISQTSHPIWCDTWTLQLDKCMLLPQRLRVAVHGSSNGKERLLGAVVLDLDDQPPGKLKVSCSATAVLQSLSRQA